ncbi:MAG: glutamate--tRNA ligase family protein [Terracidiphilus sp.]|jgi:glutamyl-tRNA synthetase
MGSLPPSPASGYRGRLAPSPTGYLHVGHARTFWTAFERARDAGGTLMMRMEDLDPDRSRSSYAEAAIEDLRWLGIRWQEGPGREGSGSPASPHEEGVFAPYAQSLRRAFYLAAWRKLLQRGFLYPCRCSRKDLETALAAPHEAGPAGSQSNGEVEPLDDEPVYPGTCRPAASSGLENVTSRLPCSAANEIGTPDGINWRFRVPDGEAIDFEDRNLGPQRFVAGRDFGDFVVWRRDGVPSYQLACVADDAAMGITEVVRGADLLKSTARQILLNRALGYNNPAWFHCCLVVDANGRRLAKRNDSLSVRTLRQRGLTPTDILAGKLPLEA